MSHLALVPAAASRPAAYVVDVVPSDLFPQTQEAVLINGEVVATLRLDRARGTHQAMSAFGGMVLSQQVTREEARTAAIDAWRVGLI